MGDQSAKERFVLGIYSSTIPVHHRDERWDKLGKVKFGKQGNVTRCILGSSQLAEYFLTKPFIEKGLSSVRDTERGETWGTSRL